MEKHLTTTVYIISKIKGEWRVLLHKHKKYNVWLGVGGHIESYENAYEAALRETKEETGLKVKIIKTLKNLTETDEVTEMPLPYMIKEEKIPKVGRVKSHYHIDFIYFAKTSSPKKVSMKEEFKWFTKSEIKKLDMWEDVRFVSLAALKIGGK